MEKKSTALQQAIEKAKIEHNRYVALSCDDAYTDREKELLYVKSIALGEFINTMNDLLPVERKQIEEAFKSGASEDRLFGDDYNDYFNKTYNP